MSADMPPHASLARTTARRLWLAIAIGFAIASTSPAIAGAEPARDAESQALFVRAQAAYDARDWATAPDLLQAAYALSPRAAFLFNIGQAQRKLGRCADARESYAAYSASLSDDRTHEDARARVLAATRELDTCEEAAAQTQPAKAAPAPPMAAAESRAPAEVPQAAAAPRASEAPPKQPMPEPAPRDDLTLTIATWALVAGGAGALAAAGYFALDADHAASELERARRWEAALSEREREGRDAATLSGVLFGSGLGLLGAALAVHLAFSSETPAPLTVVAGPDRALAQFRRAF